MKIKKAHVIQVIEVIDDTGGSSYFTLGGELLANSSYKKTPEGSSGGAGEDKKNITQDKGNPVYTGTEAEEVGVVVKSPPPEKIRMEREEEKARKLELDNIIVANKAKQRKETEIE